MKRKSLHQEGLLRIIQKKLNLEAKKEEFGEESGTGGSADPMAFPFDWHKDLILNFAKSINTNIKFEITGKEALKVHYLIDAMIESSKKNMLITME